MALGGEGGNFDINVARAAQGACIETLTLVTNSIFTLGLKKTTARLDVLGRS
jgi:hypothetical protein